MTDKAIKLRHDGQVAYTRKADRRYLSGAGNPVSPYVLTRKGANAVRELCAKGGSKAAIGQLLRIDRETVDNLLKRDPLMEEAVNDGLAEFDTYLTNQITTIGTSEKQWAAFLALGKVKLGWKEGEAPDHVPRPSPVQVNINLVSPASSVEEVTALIGELPPEEPSK